MTDKQSFVLSEIPVQKSIDSFDYQDNCTYKDRQYCPKTKNTVIELEVKPEHFYL